MDESNKDNFPQIYFVLQKNKEKRMHSQKNFVCLTLRFFELVEIVGERDPLIALR